MKNFGLAFLVAMTVLLAPLTATAKPVGGRKPVAIKKRGAKAVVGRESTDPKKLGAHARVAFRRAGELRTARDMIGRRAEPLTAEEATAAQIQKLLRGPLRRGITGLYVADARTGEPLFSVNAEDPLNPASNVKLVATATALELLGPDFRYPTRVLGPEPAAGVVRGDIYLLGSYDPTLTASDMHDIAAALALRGVKTIEGHIVVGSDRTRDGIYRSIVPVEITAGEPGQPPTATLPPNFDLVTVEVTATTSKRVHRPRLTYKAEVVTNEHGYPRIALSIGGTIGKGGHTTYTLWTKQRTANAAYALIAALRANGIAITGEIKTGELGDYVSDAVAAGALPVELGRHESRPLADIIARINKRSVNWLADRVIMTAAALARGKQPSMDLALEEMYAWLARHPQVPKTDILLDTGSGLSYRTEMTAEDIVSVVRSAAGYTSGADPKVADAFVRSLAIAGRDGTLRGRFRGSDAQGRILGKTGTLSTVIALSGILDIDPNRPLAFALVTNGDSPLSKNFVRKAHEQVIGEICNYLEKTAKAKPIAAPAPVEAAPPPPPSKEEVEESEAETPIDVEAAGAAGADAAD